MYYSEFVTTLAMLNISLVSFIWIIKQIIMLAHWAVSKEDQSDSLEFQKKLEEL